MGKITVETCEIEGLKIITPTVFGDARGYFMETYNYNDFKKALIYHPFIDFLQLFDFIFCRFIGFLLSIFALPFFCFVHFFGIMVSEPIKGRQLF